MSNKIHQPGTPLKKARVGRAKPEKTTKKSHGKGHAKDWFGAAPGIKDAEHM